MQRVTSMHRLAARFPFLAPSALATLLAVGLAACADDPAALGSTLEAPLTLDEGHKFLVSIDGNRVVLERKVGTHPLPFTDQQFVGKNIVIHPKSASRGEDGVFARVLRVEDVGKTRVALIVRPLELDELGNAARNGDDTLTIYKNPSLRELPRELGTSNDARYGVGGGGRSDAGTYGTSIGTLTLPFGELSPLTTEQPERGVSVPWPPTLSNMGTLTTTLSGGASTKFRDLDFSFEPGLSGKWVEGRGLELGARLALSTKMKIDIDALLLVGKPIMQKVGESTLVALTSAGPITLVEAPVLLGGVYTTVGVKASIGCFARVEQHFKGTLDIDIAAVIEGSAMFEISPSSPSEEWITEGAVPFSSSGHAYVNFVPEESSTKPSIFCELPRLTVFVQPGGKVLDSIGGPQVFLASVGKFYSAWDAEPDISVALAAGVTAKPLGKQVTAETTLLTWRP